ncbi:unnamed protein product [Calypogeia fissa]
MPGEDLRVKKKDDHCSTVPSLVSAFVDSFVDFAVGGQFLGPNKFSERPEGQNGVPNGLKGEENGQDGSPLPTRIPAPERLIAIGDIHGDLGKAKEALRIAKVMDEANRWIGGKTVVVQVGDILDRGGDEIKVFYLLEKLKGEARKAGGDVHIMNGNHEVMNMESDFRCISRAGVDEFQRWADWYKMGNVLKERCKGLEKPYDFFKNVPQKFSKGLKARMAALRPGGPISSRFLANHPTVLVVGGSVFVHGGLLPTHIEHGLEKINEETRQWMLGRKEFFGPDYLHGRDAIVWVRKYSNEDESECECDVLEKALSGVSGAKRMVVGHTIQEKLGVNAACNNKVLRVDVGMSKGCCNTTPEVLEIRDDKVLTVLSANSSLRLTDGEDMPSYLKRQHENPGLASLLTSQSPQVKVPG